MSAIVHVDKWLREKMKGEEVRGLRYEALLECLQQVEFRAEEEQAQKPTAPAGLVWCKSGNKPCDTHECHNDMEIDPCLSAEHRSAPSIADEGWGGMEIKNCLLPPKPPKSYCEAVSLYRDNPFFNKVVEMRAHEIYPKPPANADMVEDEFEKWLKIMSEKASYSDQRELLRVVLSHYEESCPVKSPADDGLVEALEKLSRLGNGDIYGNSDGNRIAQEALARYKASDKGVK